MMSLPHIRTLARPITIATLPILFFLGLSVHGAEPKKKEEAKKPKTIELGRYRRHRGPLRIEGVSDNCSGLTYNFETKALMVVIDAPEMVIELSLSGKPARRIGLSGFRDTEGIAHAGGNKYYVAEEGNCTVSLIEIDKDANLIDRDECVKHTIDPKYAMNSGMEGLAFDPKGKRLFAVKEKGPRKIYEFPAFKKGAKPKVTAPWNIQNDNLGLSDLSGICYDKETGNLLVLSHERRRLVECTTDGKPISSMDFSIGKAEGIAVDEKRNIYICSEPNLLYIFKKK